MILGERNALIMGLSTIVIKCSVFPANSVDDMCPAWVCLTFMRWQSRKGTVTRDVRDSANDSF
jgi:hypothetical protein